MDEVQIRILIVVLFLLFGSTIVKLFKKIKNKIFKPAAAAINLKIQLHTDETITLEDLLVPIPADILNATVENHESVETIPPIESKNLDFLEEKFISEQENKVFANLAAKTFRAWKSGAMLKLFDPHNQFSRRQKKNFVPRISLRGHKEFVLYTFLGVQNSELMPKMIKPLQKQYAVFFKEVTFDEHEFLVSWGLGLILSNKRLFIFTRGDIPRIQKIIPLSEIKLVTQEVAGVQKLK